MERYRKFVRAYQQAARLALPRPKIAAAPAKKAGGPVVLLFSPHPDDEVITGTLPLRLQHEAGARVVNVAVTLGSHAARRPARARELGAACALLGWENEILGWEEITPEKLRRRPALARKRAGELANIILRWRPRWIFYPHAEDVHPAHLGVNLLVEAALKKLGGRAPSPLWRVQTEYWRPLAQPNLLIECRPENLARLTAALCCHEGEIRRNPYHRTLPAWMLDNVRRGAELVGGHGTAAPKFLFGALYRTEPRLPAGWSPVMPAASRLRA